MNNKISLAATIDHSLLRPDTTMYDIEKLCREAIDNKFASVCVLPRFVRHAVGFLEGSGVKTGTVIGFPFGANYKTAKSMEADIALHSGAEELDMVMNISEFMDKNYHDVEHEIDDIVNIAHRKKALVKVIIECCLLNDSQKIEACKIVESAGADFIKTSTGFSSGGATIEDVSLLKENIRGSLKIKAAGGIKTAEFAFALLNAGANRIGTSSGVEIIKSI